MDKDKKRYISVEQSLKESCEEVKAIRSGKIKETVWDDFYKEMQSEIPKEAV